MQRVSLPVCGVVLLLVTMLWPGDAVAQQQNKPPGSPVNIKSYVCADGKPVTGDGKHDDTTGIQVALDDASKTLVIPPGVYRITSTLRMSGNRAMVISAEPGAVFQFRPIDGSTTCIELRTNGAPMSVRKAIYGLTLIGPRPQDPPKDPTYQPGKLIGIKMFETQQGELANVRIIGFDGVGLFIDHCYYWSIRNLDVRYNGWGVKCDGANATFFYNLQAQYNVYGYENVQSIMGGAIEGNFKSGGRYTEIGTRYSVHDVWFEQNNLGNSSPGEADIWANDPKGEWAPVVLSLSGCTTFHNTYSAPGVDERAVPTHNIAGCLHLSLSGAVRFFEESRWHNFSMHRMSKITDGSVGDAMADVKNGFDGQVFYARPEFKVIGPQ